MVVEPEAHRRRDGTVDHCAEAVVARANDRLAIDCVRDRLPEAELLEEREFRGVNEWPSLLVASGVLVEPEMRCARARSEIVELEVGTGLGGLEAHDFVGS